MKLVSTAQYTGVLTMSMSLLGCFENIFFCEHTHGFLDGMVVCVCVGGAWCVE